MYLYYAFGGGLGHLCRSKSVIDTLHLPEHEFIILTNSPYVNLVFKKAKIVQITAGYYNKKKELNQLIHSIIVDYKISDFYIDTFPGGIIGELNDLEANNVKMFYIARILNWENYAPLISPNLPRFDKTYIIEELPYIQYSFIKSKSNYSEKIKLIYSSNYEFKMPDEFKNEFNSPPWLIVHTGSFEELTELHHYASDIAEFEGKYPWFLVISQTSEKLSGENIRQINYFPASDFFSFAEKIFTACGFNSMYQTQKFGHKHFFIPFHRKFDDQFLRAAQRKSSIRKLEENKD